jgi:hypothetical protein
VDRPGVAAHLRRTRGQWRERPDAFRPPTRFLTSEHDRQTIQVGNHAAIDGLIKGEQLFLVREKLAHGDLLFALLRELRPVGGDSLFVIEPAS